MGLFTDSLLLLRCLPLGFDAPPAQWIGTDFSQAENLSMRARFNGHAPRGQKSIAQRQAKRRPGYNVPCSLRPVREKVLKTERVMFTFALAGRGVIGCGGLPRVSLRLPWAEEAIGLSARLVNSAIRQSHTARE